MKEYEVIWEIFNKCPRNQMRDVFVEEVEIEKEHFYLMEHNEYGASVAPVLVNGDGKVVAQDLENGLDQEAVKAIREYLEEKEIAKKQEKVETSNASLFEEAEREAAYQIETTGQFFFIQQRKGMIIPFTIKSFKN